MGNTIESEERPALSEESASRSDVLRASPQMFSWKPIDFFSRVHPSVPVIIYLPVIVVMSIWGLSEASVWSVLGLAVVGYLIWTLFEYWLHRIVFHFEPERGIGAYMHWVIHGIHHDHPNDPLRLVMPPAASLPIGASVFGLLWLIFGSQHAPAVGAGFFVGYLIYDMTHYYVHHYLPRGRLGRMLRERHMRHHFQDETRGFGISAPYWDEVFGTSPRSRSAQTGADPPLGPDRASERKKAVAATNINRVVLTGNLTADPELRSLPSGMSVCSLRVACNTRRKDQASGEWVDKPNYFNVTVWGAQGENAARYLTKGRPVAIDGRLEWREWDAQDGSKRSAVDIIADSVQFLGSRDDAGNGNGFAGGRSPSGSEVPADEGDFRSAPVGGGEAADDIPF